MGRGILIDYAAFCKRNGITVDPFSSTAIPLSDLQRIAAEEGVTPRVGDILFVRVGFTTVYNTLDAEGRRNLAARPKPNFLGVESTVDTLRWIWESGFAAVAGDAPSFEQAPIEGEHTRTGGVWKGQSWEEEMQGGGLLHQWLLGGWGLPIGEMFDLEALSKKCEELGRWSFFVSSVPLKVSHPRNLGHGM